MRARPIARLETRARAHGCRLDPMFDLGRLPDERPYMAALARGDVDELLEWGPENPPGVSRCCWCCGSTTRCPWTRHG